MIHLYRNGFSEQEKKGYVTVIMANILINMQTLCIQATNYGGVDAKAEDVRVSVLALKEDQPLTTEIADQLVLLWNDAGIQRAYANRAHFQLLDSIKYFMGRVKVVAAHDYLPSQEDVFNARAATRAIIEHNFVIKDRIFKMVDVGGQRAMRKNWLHCFEKVTCVIFVAAISEFDQVLEEDEKTNRLSEALELFSDICNSRWFRRTSMILFLNKSDILAEKLKTLQLKTFCPDYEGDNSYESACKYFEKAFMVKNRKLDKIIYPHITCATDTRNIEITFDTVRDIIVRKAVQDLGLKV
jgi:hypothetical protein